MSFFTLFAKDAKAPRTPREKIMRPGLKDNIPPIMREPDPRLDEVVRKVIGAAINVHRELGPGYPEKIYANALDIEMQSLGITFQRELEIPIRYKNTLVGEAFIDFYVDNALVVEIKAVEDLLPVHTSQVISYLKATGNHLGLLINFDVRILKDGVKRVVRS